MNLSNSKSKTTKTTLIFVVIILIVVLIIGFITIPRKPYKLSLSNNSISINGWGSTTINLDSITEIKLLNNSPNVIFNSGGGSLDNKIFGNEHLATYGNTHCYVENANDKAIYLKTSKEQYLIALDNSNSTSKLYNEIIQKNTSL